MIELEGRQAISQGYARQMVTAIPFMRGANGPLRGAMWALNATNMGRAAPSSLGATVAAMNKRLAQSNKARAAEQAMRQRGACPPPGRPPK
jgi:hypothetical protein